MLLRIYISLFFLSFIGDSTSQDRDEDIKTITLGSQQYKENETYIFSVEPLVGLPTEIGYLTQLKTLSLSRVRVSNLPTEIGLCTKLEQLYIAGQLSSIPTEIGQCVNLKDVALGQNNLVTLPSEIGLCTNLVELTLYHNQLISIPTEIGKCSHLEKLYLSHNNLKNIPWSIRELPSLKYISLMNNPLTDKQWMKGLVEKDIKAYTELCYINYLQSKRYSTILVAQTDSESCFSLLPKELILLIFQLIESKATTCG